MNRRVCLPRRLAERWCVHHCHTSLPRSLRRLVQGGHGLTQCARPQFLLHELDGNNFMFQRGAVTAWRATRMDMASLG